MNASSAVVGYIETKGTRSTSRDDIVHHLGLKNRRSFKTTDNAICSAFALLKRDLSPLFLTSIPLLSVSLVSSL